MTEEVKSLECPVCHTKVTTLYRLDLEEWCQGYSKGILLLCGDCLSNPELGRLLADLGYEAVQSEDSDLEAFEED